MGVGTSYYQNYKILDVGSWLEISAGGTVFEVGGLFEDSEFSGSTKTI